MLTPLVDIIFILLMFFMLSSSFTKYATLQFSAKNTEDNSRAGDAQAPTNSFAGIIINLNQTRGLTVNGERQSMDTLVAALNRLYDRGSRSAIVTTDRFTNVQQFVTTVETARESKLTAITIAR